MSASTKSTYNARSAIQVRLSLSEMARAAHVGVQRHLKCLERGSKPAHGADEHTLWQIHIEGALGECAVAKALNVYWEGGIDTFQKYGDVGGYEVRTTPLDSGRLIIRSVDIETRRFVLVTGENGWYTVHGWLVGKDAKRDEWIDAPNNRPPAWFAPQSALRPLSDLVPGGVVLARNWT